MSREGKSWIQTYTGRRFELFEPDPFQVDIRDIAHHLSQLCRFTGACQRFYSVAEHSVRVSRRCAELVRSANAVVGDEGESLHATRWGLLHDAAEAYCADLNRPLKHQPELALYRETEKRIMAAIAERFSLGEEPPEIGVADDELLWTEAMDLMSPMHPDWIKTVKTVREPLPEKIDGWSPQRAERMFLRRFNILWPEWDYGA